MAASSGVQENSSEISDKFIPSNLLSLENSAKTHPSAPWNLLMKFMVSNFISSLIFLSFSLSSVFSLPPSRLHLGNIHPLVGVLDHSYGY